MAKKYLKTALEHAADIQVQRNLEELRRLDAAAARKKKEHEEAEKRKLIELQKNVNNLYAWTVYPEEYYMESGIAWASNFVEANEKVRKMFPDAIRYIVKPIDVTSDIVNIASYIE